MVEVTICFGSISACNYIFNPYGVSLHHQEEFTGNGHCTASLYVNKSGCYVASVVKMSFIETLTGALPAIIRKC